MVRSTPLPNHVVNLVVNWSETISNVNLVVNSLASLGRKALSVGERLLSSDDAVHDNVDGAVFGR